jgi:hypothetical protein
MTAYDFLQGSFTISHFYNDKYNEMVCFSKDVEKAMIEFAKYHVEQALKAASETKLEANYDNTGIDEKRYPNDKSLILNAYPLKNIK